jgi:hypothetical protein
MTKKKKTKKKELEMTVEKSTATSFYHYLWQHKYGLNFEMTIEGLRKRTAIVFVAQALTSKEKK